MENSEVIIPEIRLIFCIVPRNKGNVLVETCESFCQGSKIVLRGRGTATSEMLEILGLEETSKDIVIMFVHSDLALHTLEFLSDKLSLEELGEGIAFSIDVNAIGGMRTLGRLLGIKVKKPDCKPPIPYVWSKEDQAMENADQNDLIVTIIERGFADDVMDAAKEAGATGGTILHARGAGVHETEKFLGVPIQPEKELVLNIVPREIRNKVMRTICEAAGLKQPGKGLVFSVPVDGIAGVTHHNK
ncbi:MAG: P-II family nitrogen regulator [Bacillota bacterium]|jgi:nitrogen regulatory protein PII